MTNATTTAASAAVCTEEAHKIKAIHLSQAIKDNRLIFGKRKTKKIGSVNLAVRGCPFGTSLTVIVDGVPGKNTLPICAVKLAEEEWKFPKQQLMLPLENPQELQGFNDLDNLVLDKATANNAWFPERVEKKLGPLTRERIDEDDKYKYVVSKKTEMKDPDTKLGTGEFFPESVHINIPLLEGTRELNKDECCIRYRTKELGTPEWKDIRGAQWLRAVFEIKYVYIKDGGFGLVKELVYLLLEDPQAKKKRNATDAFGADFGVTDGAAATEEQSQQPPPYSAVAVDPFQAAFAAATHEEQQQSQPPPPSAAATVDPFQAAFAAATTNEPQQQAEMAQVEVPPMEEAEPDAANAFPMNEDELYAAVSVPGAEAPVEADVPARPSGKRQRKTHA